MHRGFHDEYQWLTTEVNLVEILTRCPEVIAGKYVAVTSFNSGALLISDGQVSQGWRRVAGIAYSPQVKHVGEVPRVGFDEWYVFSQDPGSLGQATNNSNAFETGIVAGFVQVFVNYYGFVLHDPAAQSLAALFWKQLHMLQPDSFVADGSEFLSFVSKNEYLFAMVQSAIIGLERVTLRKPIVSE